MPPLITVNKAPAAAATPSTFQSQSSFSQKLLNFSFTLASGSAGNQPSTFSGTNNSNSVSIAGHRARCRITNAGAPAGSTAEISIYGMSQSLMNQLATLGIAVDSISKNSVIVSAGTGQAGGSASAASAASSPASGFPVVFGGTIFFAYGDYGDMPNVPFKMIAQGGLFNAVQSVAPSSFTGPTSVATIMQKFASQLGVTFENNGVTAQLSNPYYPGTILQQIYQIAEHANVHAQLVDGGTKLAIWPIGGSRTSQTNIPLISMDTGMIAAPTFANYGWMVVKMVYNPDVVFYGNIQVQSEDVPQANNTWTVYKLDLALDTLLPDGDWMATALCYPKGVNAPAPPTVSS
jgi:hypothetical protein